MAGVLRTQGNLDVDSHIATSRVKNSAKLPHAKEGPETKGPGIVCFFPGTFQGSMALPTLRFGI